MKQAENVQCFQHTHGKVGREICHGTTKNVFLRAKRKMKKHKTTQTLRALQAARTIYSKCCKVNKTVHEEQVTEAHMKLTYENPRLFWKAVKPNKKT